MPTTELARRPGRSALTLCSTSRAHTSGRTCRSSTSSPCSTATRPIITQALDAEAIRTAAADTVGIVTREEHTVLGGFGSAGLATPYVRERVASFAAGAA